ncbi:MAG: hypothetical protein QOH47_1394 [Sphingomonadales bacterium]|jgi:hypothetical protein|nr:hypothetical protein [Sphingomonadales bacterium]
MRRLAYTIAEATPALIAFGPVAALAGMITAWAARFRWAAAA